MIVSISKLDFCVDQQHASSARMGAVMLGKGSNERELASKERNAGVYFYSPVG